MEPTARASPRAEGWGKEFFRFHSLLFNFQPVRTLRLRDDTRVLTIPIGSANTKKRTWSQHGGVECCACRTTPRALPRKFCAFQRPRRDDLRRTTPPGIRISLCNCPINYLKTRYGLGGGRSKAVGPLPSQWLHDHGGVRPYKKTGEGRAIFKNVFAKGPQRRAEYCLQGFLALTASAPSFQHQQPFFFVVFLECVIQSHYPHSGLCVSWRSKRKSARLPSHMRDQARRAPSKAATVAEVEDEGDMRPQASATYVSKRPPASPPSSAAPATTHDVEVSARADASFTTTSELKPGSSVETSQHGSTPRAALDNESVTAALLKRAVASPEAERFFTGAGRSLLLFKESLPESVERYHNPYDPASNTDEDPLLCYGAVGGELPGYDSASSLLLREVVMRYQYPHKSFDWARMSDLIDTITSKDGEVLIMPTANIAAGSRGFALNLADLSHVAQAVVGVQQILSALNAFLSKNPARSFDVDPGFALLYLLEFSDTPADLRLALTCLQLRLQRADVHIRSYLSSIRLTTTGDGFSSRVSSTDSTLSEVREEYGGSHPRKELYRLVARPDYGCR
ncbi:hypothetical protein C8R46DRAFT_1030575 [Mycena filopes]|nr:hypothetical protein C8R46DRAFT_1030575 [Mycena filopes]